MWAILVLVSNDSQELNSSLSVKGVSGLVLIQWVRIVVGGLILKSVPKIKTRLCEALCCHRST